MLKGKKTANSVARKLPGTLRKAIKVTAGILFGLFLMSSMSNECDASEKNKQSSGLEGEICSISEYSFQDQKQGKKIVELYEKALEAQQDEFILVAEEKKLRWFKSSEIWYKKSIDSGKASFRYYGDVNKDAKPNGMGILVRNWDEMNRESEDIPGWIKLFLRGGDDSESAGKDIYVEIVYIGEFKDGFKEGYGIELSGDGKYDIPIITYEGEFARGRMDGKGSRYFGMAGGDFYDEDFQDRLIQEYRVEYSEEADNALMFPTVAKSVMHYEGAFKNGMRDGKGAEYYGNEAEMQDAGLKYKGEFKNDRYSGSGTLYFEDGTVWYEGKFKNGKFDGKGILYDKQGKVVHKGKFKNGEVK